MIYLWLYCKKANSTAENVEFAEILREKLCVLRALCGGSSVFAEESFIEKGIDVRDWG